MYNLSLEERVKAGHKFKGIHDSEFAIHHRTYYQGMREWEARKIAFRICESERIPYFKINFSSRPTVRRGGTCFLDQKKIVLYPGAQTIGVLIHELAHILYPRHTAGFSNYQTRLLKLYDKLFPPSDGIIPEEDPPEIDPDLEEMILEELEGTKLRWKGQKDMMIAIAKDLLQSFDILTEANLNHIIDQI